MSYEIELKAHVVPEDVGRVKDCLLSAGAEYIGPTDKFDIYWAKSPDGEPVFRTRRQLTSHGPEVLFTAKPSKTKSEKGTEENQELEFCTPDKQWDNVLTFCSGIGLQVCRLKWKKGFEYYVDVDGFTIHAELLDVRYLGWFLELEICVDDIASVDAGAADGALRKLLAIAGIPEDAVEGRGYNKLLRDVGKEKG
jgi:adenylate cyclase class IV